MLFRLSNALLSPDLEGATPTAIEQKLVFSITNSYSEVSSNYAIWSIKNMNSRNLLKSGMPLPTVISAVNTKKDQSVKSYGDNPKICLSLASHFENFGPTLCD